MKLLRVKARNIKNCKDDFTIDFIAKAKKNDEDKLYELQEIAENLYTFNTMAFVGKNASGKTTAIDLVSVCYWIIDTFHIPYSDKYERFNNVELEIYFYFNKSIYKYITKLTINTDNIPRFIFEDEQIYKKDYFKSNVNKIFDNNDFKLDTQPGNLPADTSKLFYVFNKIGNRCIAIDCDINMPMYINWAFKFIESKYVPTEIFNNILSLFDENINGLEHLENGNYMLNYKGEKKEMSAAALSNFLSSGTNKGIGIYNAMIASLLHGSALIIDEIENHFHKTLVENMISLYKDPLINKNHATLIFSTHYCELLDLFGRQDNIWITKSDGQIYIENMYEKHRLRSEIVKSKQFYSNAFDTAVNYDKLMELRKALKNRSMK